MAKLPHAVRRKISKLRDAGAERSRAYKRFLEKDEAMNLALTEFSEIMVLAHALDTIKPVKEELQQLGKVMRDWRREHMRANAREVRMAAHRLARFSSFGLKKIPYEPVPIFDEVSGSIIEAVKPIGEFPAILTETYKDVTRWLIRKGTSPKGLETALDLARRVVGRWFRLTPDQLRRPRMSRSELTRAFGI